MGENLKTIVLQYEVRNSVKNDLIVYIKPIFSELFDFIVEIKNQQSEKFDFEIFISFPINKDEFQNVASLSDKSITKTFDIIETINTSRKGNIKNIKQDYNELKVKLLKIMKLVYNYIGKETDLSQFNYSQQFLNRNKNRYGIYDLGFSNKIFHNNVNILNIAKNEPITDSSFYFKTLKADGPLSSDNIDNKEEKGNIIYGLYIFKVKNAYNSDGKGTSLFGGKWSNIQYVFINATFTPKNYEIFFLNKNENLFEKFYPLWVYDPIINKYVSLIDFSYNENDYINYLQNNSFNDFTNYEILFNPDLKNYYGFKNDIIYDTSKVYIKEFVNYIYTSTNDRYLYEFLKNTLLNNNLLNFIIFINSISAIAPSVPNVFFSFF